MRRFFPHTILAIMVAVVACLIGYQQGRQSIREPVQIAPGASKVLIHAAGAGSSKKVTGPAGDHALDEVASLSVDDPAFGNKVRGIFSDPLPSRRLAKLQIFLDGCNSDQLQAMVPLIRENDLKGTGSGKEWELVMQTWGRKDGEKVLDFIRDFDWSSWHHLAQPGARYQALYGWATADPQSMKAFIENPANAERLGGDSLSALVNGWTTNDPQAAAQWMLSQPALAKSGMMQLAVDAMCRKDGQSKLDSWFESLPPGQKDHAGLASAMTNMKNRFEPEKAAEWLDQQKGRAWAEDNQLIPATAINMARRDPVAALKWAGDRESEPSVGAVMVSWCQRDSLAASHWLKANPQYPYYDNAALAIIESIEESDLEAARAWAGTLKNPDLKESALSRLGR